MKTVVDLIVIEGSGGKKEVRDQRESVLLYNLTSSPYSIVIFFISSNN